MSKPKKLPRKPIPSLIKLFRAHRDESFAIVELGGNCGDYLIYEGVYRLLRRLKIKHTIHRRIFSGIDKDDVIYIQGCGGYNSWNWIACFALCRIVENYPKSQIIVGPSTTSLELNFLKRNMPKNSSNITFFAREWTTFGFLRKNSFYENLFCDEDTSFYLNRNDALFKGITLEDRYKLLIVKQGVEAIKILPKKIRKNYFDYDKIIDPCHVDQTRAQCNFGFGMEQWIKIHARAKSITANRCHSAILGAILKKPVFMFRNKYHKNRSVWNYSLKKRNVKWIGD